jgi:uncharacterized protein YqgC (DUF456 family)
MIAGLLIVLGLAGTVLPALPGTLLILLGIWLGAWVEDFNRIGATTLAIETVLALLSWVLDYLSGVLGARRAGASRAALAGAALGTVAGIFAGFVGVLLLPFVGAAVGEYLARRDERRALHVGVATGLGLVAGIVAKVVLAFVMLGVLGVALWL